MEICPLCNKACVNHTGAVAHYRAHVRRREMELGPWTPDGQEFRIPGKTKWFIVGMPGRLRDRDMWSAKFKLQEITP